MNIAIRINSIPCESNMNKDASTMDFIPFTHSDLELSIPARFERQVQRYPDKLAIKTRSQSLSYAELNRSATAVRHLLVDSEAPVAVLFEQGIPLVTAILAVLKAGRIYVPLDPSDSRERIDFMLRDSAATHILTDEKNYLLASAWKSTDRKVSNTGSMEGIEYDVSATSVGPDNSAYIYYTSGSTGKPKGVYVWCEVLDVSRVGVNDNFLHLGGDSLQAMGIVNRINVKLLATLSFYAVLEHSTVAELARVVADSKASDSGCQEPVRAQTYSKDR
jgi:aryl carrier-like protein